jgi:hypothetical protein
VLTPSPFTNSISGFVGFTGTVVFLIEVKEPDWYIELVPTELTPVNTGT